MGPAAVLRSVGGQAVDALRRSRTPRVRIALVGAGPEGAALLDVVAGWPEADVRVVVDLDAEGRLLRKAQALGIPVASQLREAFAQPVDLVLDATDQPHVLESLVAGRPPDVSIIGGCALRVFLDVLEQKISATRQLAAQDQMGAATVTTGTAHPGHFAALLEINKKIGTVSAEALLNAIAEEAARLLEVDNAGFRLLEGDELVLAGVAGAAAETMLRPRIRVGESFSGKVVAEGRTLVLTLDQARDLVAEHLAADRRLGYTTLLGVPLQIGERTIGALTFRSRRPFTRRDQELAEAFAGQAAVALEHARLYRESVQRLQRMQALTDVARLLSESLDVGAVVTRIIESVQTLLRVHFPVLYRVEPESGDLVARAVYDELVPNLGQQLRIPAGMGAAGLAVQLRQPVATPDVLADPRITLGPELRRQIGGAPFRAVLAVPLVVGDRVVGALAMGDTAGRSFDEDEIHLAQTFAAQAAIALENARLYAAQEVRANGLRTLADLNRIISSSLDANEVLGRIAQAAADLMEAPLVEFWLADNAARQLELRLFSNQRFGEDKPLSTLSFGQGGAGWAAAHRRPLHIPDIRVDERIRVREWWATHGLTSGLWVPIVLQDELLGVLSLIGRKPFRLGPDQQELLESFVAQAAVAIRNSRLFEESEARRQAAEALAEVGRVLSQALEPGDVAQRIVDSLCHLLGCQASALFRLEPSSDDLVRVAVSGDVDPLGEQVVFPKGIGVMALAVRERKAVATPDLLTDSRVVLTPEMRGRIEQAGYRAVLAIPLLVQDRVIGALAVGDRGGRQFDHRQVQLAQTFGDQAALALENARLYAEARHAYQELSRAQTQLVRGETLRAVGELAAGTAHHLNNLLAVVLGRVQLLLRKCQDPELRRHLVPAERAALDGADVVARLSRFSRRQTEPALGTVDLNALIEEVVELTRSRWQDELAVRGIQVAVTLERGTIPPVAGDASALREVLVNLILNALDAMPNGGGIAIATWTANDEVHCRVADSGIGMPPEILRRAFEPFFTTKGVKSTGLGLSVNYGILQRHGGTIALESVEGQGTAVLLRLPAQSDVDRPPSEALPQVDRRPLRILLIEDEFEVRKVMSDMLIEDGHEVIEATSGAEGLARFFHDSAVDLVLADLGMPGMTGWEVARAVKASNPSLVVGIVTGWGEEPQAGPEDRAWADFVLGKPITQESLRGAVAHAHLRRGAP